MQLKDNKSIKKAVVLIAVMALSGAIGVVLSAQMGPRRGVTQGPGMMGQGGQHGGPGMMGGPDMMGGPRGQRGGPGMMGGRHGGPMGGPLGMLGPGLRELNLTDAQHDQIRAAVESQATAFEAAGTRMREAREALHDAIIADGADEATIRQKAAEVGAIEADMAVLHSKVIKDALAVLTPEQQKKAKELRTQMEERMKNRRERIRTRVDEGLDKERGGPQAV